MQAIWFFLSVFFGIMGGYFILSIILYSLTKRLSEGYMSGRRLGNRISGKKGGSFKRME